ncbi:MAG: hypothetical protein K8S97_15845 [Anaerolineae bacterium]|nr:hypothetical protein [Anaerolineae bacterium]
MLNLLEISAFAGDGYQPLVDYGDWRVAMLRYHPELEANVLTTMQRHNETDEVFVLLSGHCILFLGEGANQVTTIHAADMVPLQLYNVKRGAWHTHTLSNDASVLIVENRDTVVENSPVVSISAVQQAEIVRLTQQLWSTGDA